MSRYVALLRGINVGGKNLIKMTALKTCFEAQGLDDVVTYIQSGNVLFTAPGSGRARLVARLEEALAATFDYRASLALRTRDEMKEIVGRAPAGFGEKPDEYRYDVVFLEAPLRAATAIRGVVTREGVDRAWAGKGVLYFSRLTARATQSQLSKLTALPIYQSMTIRNWNTTTKLLTLMSE